MATRRNVADSKLNPAPPTKSMVATMFKRPDSARKEKPQEKSDSLYLKTDTFTTPNGTEEERIPELDERVLV